MKKNRQIHIRSFSEHFEHTLHSFIKSHHSVIEANANRNQFVSDKQIMFIGIYFSVQRNVLILQLGEGYRSLGVLLSDLIIFPADGGNHFCTGT